MGEIPNSMKAVIQTAKAEEEEELGIVIGSDGKNAKFTLIKSTSLLAKDEIF